MQSKFSQNAVKMQLKCSQNAVRMQSKFSQNATKMQSKFSQFLVKFSVIVYATKQSLSWPLCIFLFLFIFGFMLVFSLKQVDSSSWIIFPDQKGDICPKVQQMWRATCVDQRILRVFQNGKVVGLHNSRIGGHKSQPFSIWKMQAPKTNMEPLSSLKFPPRASFENFATIFSRN